MSNCYSYPWQGREIAVKNALSAAAKARLHRVQRSPIEYKAGECSATQVERCIYKHSIRSSNPIFFNDLPHLLCEGGFFCWVWVCCCYWVFCWFGFAGYFCLACLVGLFGFFSRTTIHILWKCLHGEANCTSLGHGICNLGASNRADTCPLLSGKLEAWGHFVSWYKLAPKIAKCDNLKFPSKFSISFICFF